MNDSNSRIPRATPYFVHALTPLHFGAGEGLSTINLPTVRERFTNYPFGPGSTVKGVLREHAEVLWGEHSRQVLSVFGPPTEHAADARGGVVFTDASLLCLPVRSIFGTWAWITSRVALRRVARELDECGLEHPPSPAADADTVNLPRASVLAPKTEGRPQATAKVYLEDLSVDATITEKGDPWADWIGRQVFRGPQATADRTFFSERFLVAPDDIFDFFCRSGLEVRSRVKMDDTTGTAAASGPWMEEHLPAESILWGLAIARPTMVFDYKKKPTEQQDEERKGEPRYVDHVYEDLKSLADKVSVLRLGGHASIGLGRARWLFGGVA